MPASVPSAGFRPRQVAGLAVLVLALAGPLIVRAVAGARVTRIAAARLGEAAAAVIVPDFVGETRLDLEPELPAFAPLIVLPGVVTAPGSAKTVTVYGVDRRFWRLQKIDLDELGRDEVVLSQDLAAALAAKPGDTVAVAIPDADDIPRASVHGQWQRPGQMLRGRLSSRTHARLAMLSPLDTTRDLPAVYVPLARLQQASAWAGRVNAFLIGQDGSAAAARAAIDRDAVDDYGLTLRTDAQANVVAVDAWAGQLADTVTDAIVRAAFDVGGLPTPVLTTLANRIAAGGRQINYAFIAGLDLQALSPEIRSDEREWPPMVLNQRAAQRLAVKPGDLVHVDYPVWRSSGRLETDSARFELVAVVPLSGFAASPGLTPSWPGIAGVPRLRDWSPRLPFEAARVEAADAAYWEAFGAAPQAFVPIDVARANWGTPAGAATSVAITPADAVTLGDTRDRLEAALRQRLAPAMAGIHIRDLAAEWQRRATGAAQGWHWLSLWALPLAGAGALVALQPLMTRRSAWHAALVLAFCAASAIVLVMRAPAGQGAPASVTGGYRETLETVVPVPVPPSPGLTRVRIHDLAYEGGFASQTAPLRLAAVDDQFIEEARFVFVDSLERSDEERRNPWLLLRREQRDRSDPSAATEGTPIVPAVATAGTLQKHARKLGDDFTISIRGHELRLRVVAAAADGPLDGLVLISDFPFLHWFPSSGYRWFAVDGEASASDRSEPLDSALLAAGAASRPVATATAVPLDAVSVSRWLRLTLALAALAVTAAGLAAAHRVQKPL